MNNQSSKVLFTSELQRGAVALLLVLLSTIASTQPASAEEYAANTLVYKNKGAYIANFYVRWNSAGVTCRAYMPAEKQQSSGETGTIDLSRGRELVFVEGDDGTCPLREGEEVWAKILIVVGEFKNCRKESKIRYHKDGGTVRYSTGGTTLNSNRCRVDEWPETTWSSLQP